MIRLGAGGVTPKDRDVPPKYGEDKTFGLHSRFVKTKKRPPIPDRFITFDNALELSSAIGIFDVNHRIYCVTNGNTSMSDILEAFIVERELHVLKMHIINPSIGLDGIASLKSLMVNGYVDQIDLVLSEDFRKDEVRPGGLIPILYEHLDYENRVQIAFIGSHAKIITFETKCGLKITFHGSANLRACRALEQFVVEDNPDLHRFNVKICDELINTFFTIAKENDYIHTPAQIADAFTDMKVSQNKSTKAARQRMKNEGNKINLHSVRGRQVWDRVLNKVEGWKPSRFKIMLADIQAAQIKNKENNGIDGRG